MKPPLSVLDLLRAHARKRRRIAPLPVPVVVGLARALLPVTRSDVSGPRGVWRSWIEVVEYALEEPSTMTNAPFLHARDHLLAVISIVAQLNDGGVEHVIRTVVASRARSKEETP